MELHPQTRGKEKRNQSVTTKVYHHKITPNRNNKYDWPIQHITDNAYIFNLEVGTMILIGEICDDVFNIILKHNTIYVNKQKSKIISGNTNNTSGM